MNIPEYVTVEEVVRVCKELKISNWTTLTESRVLPEDARAILTALGLEATTIDLEEFRKGLEVELEHGMRFKDANITNNHPLLTGKIVLAHFKESLDYYRRLEVAEIEGDLLKAVVVKDPAKTHGLYKKLADAKQALHAAESDHLA